MKRFIALLAATFFLVNIVFGQSAPQSFPKAKLNLQVGEKKKEIDATVKYEQDALVLVDKKTEVAVKTFPYTNIKGAEYSYSKSPRWKTAILVSPLFLFTSGKKHWFAVQANDDYAVMQLDKTNYKLILAAFEAKTGKEVEILEDSK
jgi:hypothetical protein